MKKFLYLFIAIFFISIFYILDFPFRLRRFLGFPIKTFDEYLFRLYHYYG